MDVHACCLLRLIRATVVVGEFDGAGRDLAVAERLQKRLAVRYGKAFIENYESTDGLYYRVRVGPKPSLSEARVLAAQLGRESLGAFVVRVN